VRDQRKRCGGAFGGERTEQDVVGGEINRSHSELVTFLIFVKDPAEFGKQLQRLFGELPG
jgi:hypothetical protein